MIRLTGPVALPAGHRVHLWRYHHRTADELTAMLAAAACTLLTARRNPTGEFLLLAGRSA